MLSAKIRTSLKALFKREIGGHETTEDYLRAMPASGDHYSLPFSPALMDLCTEDVKMLHEFVTQPKVSVGFERLFSQFQGKYVMIADPGLPLPDSIYIVRKLAVSAESIAPWLGCMRHPKVMVTPSREKGMIFAAFSFTGFFQ
jgi:hypothetical protein